jgi:DNA mismatch repair protein MSH6
MSSIKKGQTSITSFFSNVNSNYKRTLSERDGPTDNNSENKVVIQEYKNNKTIPNSSDNFCTISTKKKKIIDDEEYYDNYSSLIPNADANCKEQVTNNDKELDKNMNNDPISNSPELETYKNTEEIPSVKKNFRNSTNTCSNQDTPRFMKKGIIETPSICDPALKKNNEKNKGKTTGNKKKLFDKDEDSESENSNSQVTSALNNQNRSPEDNLPEFLRYENLKDMNGKRPEDPDYDPTTLLVPDSFLKKQTQTQQQFWTFKMHNFDKVLFFKLGKFYELFFDDAIIGNKVLELNWMGSDPKKLHVGFPERNLEEKAAILVEQGFKVAVIEQVETPDEMEERNKKNKTKDKNLRRDLCNVFTKGTFSLTSNSQSSQNSEVYSNKYCIAIVNYNPKDLEILEPERENKMFFGFVLFDVSTLNFYVGEIEDDDTYNKIQSVFFTIKPEEVIYFRNNLPLFIENFIKSLSSKPLITVRKNDFNLMKSYHLVTEHFGSDQDKWDPLVNKFILDKRYTNISAAFYLSMNFLKNLLLSETVKVAKFYEYAEGIISKSSLIMDYQAIFNLELLETNLDPKKPESGSFVEFMNKCCTGFGKREMKKWLLNPLTNVDEIYSRLEIVEDFIGNYDLLTRLRNSLSKLPDFEKTCGRIYKSATQRSSKAVYFEDISKHKLNEFFKLLEQFKSSTVNHLFNLEYF